MSSIIETFHIDWQIILAQAINFGIVFVILYRFALKPLNKLMSERTEKIAKGVNDAKTNAELLDATKKEYESALTKARAEATQIFQEGKESAESKRAEMLETAKVEVKAVIDSGKKTLEAEKNKMVDDARKEIIALAIEATKKILAKQDVKNSDAEMVKEVDSLN